MMLGWQLNQHKEDNQWRGDRQQTRPMGIGEDASQLSAAIWRSFEGLNQGLVAEANVREA
jgi:hypothetical protein